ncbi:MAG: hypothetical protein IKZ25_00950 [Clostridia bacterium]|nr:hypothetical protein [Clostridia bacterium]
MKKCIFCILAVCFMFLSGCSFFETETPMSKEQAQKVALTCFEEHKKDMEDIINSNEAMGETDWCKGYNLLSDGQYEFILQQIGLTGTNTKTGILYIPDDKPYSDYKQDKEKENAYSYESGFTDKFFMERIEQNWFFFYYEYDF